MEVIKCRVQKWDDGPGRNGGCKNGMMDKEDRILYGR
jgi:hypothetical protein